MELVKTLPPGARGTYKAQYEFIDDMIQGEIAKFSKGEDFHSSPANFAQSVKHRYKSMGIDLRTVIRKDDVYVHVLDKE